MCLRSCADFLIFRPETKWIYCQFVLAMGDCCCLAAVMLHYKCLKCRFKMAEIIINCCKLLSIKMILSAHIRCNSERYVVIIDDYDDDDDVNDECNEMRGIKNEPNVITHACILWTVADIYELK